MLVHQTCFLCHRYWKRDSTLPGLAWFQAGLGLHESWQDNHRSDRSRFVRECRMSLFYLKLKSRFTARGNTDSRNFHETILVGLSGDRNQRPGW